MNNPIERDVAAVARVDVVPKILEIVCRSTGMGFAAVARVTDERWVACAVRDEIAFGLQPGGELPIATTICNEIRQSDTPVIFDQASVHPHFRNHPTPAMYGFESYISVPLRYPDGRFFGTLCAIDPKPAQIESGETLAMFGMFADLIGFHLAAAERLDASEAESSRHQESARLRDQFIAVLGHDLRNPLAAIQSSVKVLDITGLPAADSQMIAVIQRSSDRMAGLIDNLTDFARGRLGDGLTLTRDCVHTLPATIAHVMAELQVAWQGRVLQSVLAISAPVVCDIDRIAQLLSNLIANALAHGDGDGPVIVRAHTEGDDFVLSVENRGTPIPPDIQGRLFHPFTRGGDAGHAHGLGLGLYIASEIARAHGGTLTVSSTEALTCFTLRMPAAPASVAELVL